MATDAPSPEISLATWDLTSPLVINRLSKIKVGAKCATGRPLIGERVEILGDANDVVAAGALGPTPWPGTTALYWTELDFMAPAAVGQHSWTVLIPASAIEPQHAGAISHFAFLTVAPPEQNVIVEVFEKGTKAPVDDVIVRLGAYRGCTNGSGAAKLQVSKGVYDVVVWKLGYAAVPKTVDVVSDLSVQLEIELAANPEQEYWMG